MVRDLERKTASWDVVPEALTRELALAHRLLNQQRTGANKRYSLHAPEVECISKGKALKRYEFGVKVGVVASLKKPFILAAHALPGRPYDGHTLMRSLAEGTLNTGVKIKAAAADKGYRGHETWPGAKVILPGQRSGTPGERRWRRTRLRRRSVIEALIGHMKVEGLLDRNWLNGTAGDAMHAILCAAGQNLRLLLRAIAAFLRLNVQALLAWLRSLCSSWLPPVRHKS